MQFNRVENDNRVEVSTAGEIYIWLIQPFIHLFIYLNINNSFTQ